MVCYSADLCHCYDTLPWEIIVMKMIIKMKIIMIKLNLTIVFPPNLFAGTALIDEKHI